MELSFGNGGWVRCEMDGGDRGAGLPVFLVRLVPDARGRLRARELYLGTPSGAPPLTAGLLRRLPLTLVEALADEDRDAVTSRYGLPGPDLERLASHYATSYGPTGGDHWIAHSMRAQLPGSGVQQAPLAVYPAAQRASGHGVAALAPPGPDGLTDAFMQRVATAYRLAARSSGRPAAELAAQAQVSVRTVHRWVYEARKRGALGPGRQGAAG